MHSIQYSSTWENYLPSNWALLIYPYTKRVRRDVYSVQFDLPFCYTRMRTEHLSRTVCVKLGVRQECVLLSVLYNLYCEHVWRSFRNAAVVVNGERITFGTLYKDEAQGVIEKRLRKHTRAATSIGSFFKKKSRVPQKTESLLSKQDLKHLVKIFFWALQP